MIRYLRHQFEKMSFSLRFCFLSIFIVFLLILIVSLRELTHSLFMNSMMTLSFNLMEQASGSAFQQITNEMKDAEIKSNSSALLIKEGVVASKNQDELVNFTTTLMEKEAALLPRVQSVYWGDVNGNFIIARRMSNGSITSEIIHRGGEKAIHHFIFRNPSGKIMGYGDSNDFSYDPRSRPWYQAAIKEKRTVWLDIYPYHTKNNLGTSLATPVYNNQNELLGVVSFDIRLDYLRHLIEDIILTPHGTLFIVSEDGKLIAFPGLKQLKSSSLMPIEALTSQPWVTESFNLFLKKKQPKFVFQYNGKNYLATYQPIFHIGKYAWLIGAIVPEEDFVGYLVQTHLISMGFALLILIVGVVVMSALISRVIKPLMKITQQIEKIKNFDLEDTSKIKTQIKEIRDISDEIDAMKLGLRSFQKYVPATLVRELIERGEDARIGGTKKPLVIFFSDIQQFTSIAEKANPAKLTKQLCDYFDALSHIIVTHHGTIDKYIGDAIMAFWGAPSPVENPCHQAAKAALECIEKSSALNEKWTAAKYPPFITRLGIHLGDAIIGNLGSSERLNYTAIGDAINLTNRLVNINRLYGTQIIVSETIYQAIKDDFRLRMLDWVILKGRVEPSYIYELIVTDRHHSTYDLDQYNIIFKKGFEAYQQSEWVAAIDYFLQCIQVYPSDTVAPLFIARCKTFASTKPPANWKGAWVITDK